MLYPPPGEGEGEDPAGLHWVVLGGAGWCPRTRSLSRTRSAPLQTSLPPSRLLFLSLTRFKDTLLKQK